MTPDAPSRRRVALRVRGLVQGVGFRPFVYRVASDLGLSGQILNTSEGVEVEVEGPPAAVDALLQALRADLPPLARVDQLEVRDLELRGGDAFVIVESEARAGGAALVSPDVATCAACLRESRDPSDRRFRYPFVNCTDCGPRFTIVESVPYDRPRTTMRGFPLCPACDREYRDPRDRRYHAEPNACPVCGPRLALWNREGWVLPVVDPLRAAQDRLRAGEVLAVKGLGGFHLACRADDDGAIRRLRARKGRPRRPLAVMCRDLETAGRLCHVSEAEARELTSARRPIVLLQRRLDGPPLGASLAPGLDELGVMLPYTPLHHLLLEGEGLEVLVMTSGNRSGGPMVADDREAVRKLGTLVDALLVHDRPIANRCDDSVIRVDGIRTVVMRRSRGFVPLPVPLVREVRPTLALGAMLANTFTLAEGLRAFPSQHVGDTDQQDTVEFLREAVAGLQRWLGLDPEVVVHDLHPDLPTTRLAQELAGEGRRRVAVQHHLAHLAAAVAAHRRDPEVPVQALALDGTGYGPDRTIWGGELLVGTPGGARRAAWLRPLPLPGGEAAVRRPWRIAVAWLHALLPEAAALPLHLWTRGAPGEAEVIRRMVDRGFNAPRTSSAGRLFDAVSALLGVCDDASWEGQGAVELEHVARRGRDRGGLALAQGHVEGRSVLDPTPLLAGLVDGLRAGWPAEDVARTFHGALARAWVAAAVRVRDEGGPATVALCGGVFQNRLLAAAVADGLGAAGLEPLLPGPVPVGDGGLSLGQVLVADAVVRGAPGEVG